MPSRPIINLSDVTEAEKQSDKPLDPFTPTVHMGIKNKKIINKINLINKDAHFELKSKYQHRLIVEYIKNTYCEYKSGPTNGYHC